MKKFLFLLIVTYLSSHMVTGQANRDDKLKKHSLFGAKKSPVDIADDECECVPYYQCSENNNIIRNGEGLIELKSNDDCSGVMEICCKLKYKIKTPRSTPPVKNQDCGFRNPGGVGFRANNLKITETQFGEFPWMVAILYEQFKTGSNTKLHGYKCGGSIIHAQAVLTVAHQVSNQENRYIVRAGEWDTRGTKELYPHQDREVRKIVIHEDFYRGAALNDMAILFLDKPFEISPHVKPLCLPSQDFVMPAGTKCFANGWGKDVYGKAGKYQDIMKKVDLPMVEFNDCQNELRTTRVGRHFILDESFVCAGGEEGKDTCTGDGGSPLACPITGQPNRYQHIGMVAWGIGCGENGIPGVYVNVAKFRHWVDDQMKRENLDINSYTF